MKTRLLYVALLWLPLFGCRVFEELQDSKEDPTPKVEIGTSETDEPPAPAGTAATAPVVLATAAPVSPPVPALPPPAPAATAPLDLTEVMLQASALAIAENPQAHLMAANFYRVRAARTTLADGDVTLAYQYRYQDATRAPGEDIVGGSIAVNARAGRLWASQYGTSTGFLDAYERAKKEGKPLSSVFRPLPQPACTSVKAWEAAQASGMPENAVARWQLRPVMRKDQFIWHIEVEGHDELTRDIDAATCAVQGKR